MEKKDELISVNYIIPKSIEKEIVERITKRVVDGYYGNVADAVSNKVIEKFNEDKFTERVADTVLAKIKISEDDFVKGIATEVKDALLKTTGIITKEVLEKVNEKVQSYGFIKIGGGY